MALTTGILAGAPIRLKPLPTKRKTEAEVKRDKRRTAKASRRKNRK